MKISSSSKRRVKVRADYSGLGHRKVLVAIGAGLAALSASTSAWADSYSWAGNTGNFTDPTMWTGGVAPTGTNLNDALNFGGSTAYTATVDNSGATIPGFYFGSLNFNADASGGPTLVPSASAGTYPNVLNFRPGNSAINQTGAGAVNIAVPINIANGSTFTVNVASGAGQLSLANFSSTNTLIANTIFGSGNINFVNNSANAILVGDLGGLTGDIFVTSGTVIEADGNGAVYPTITGTGGGDVARGGNLIHVAAGAVFDFNSNGETMGGITGDGTIRVGAAGGLTFQYTHELTFNGVIVGPTNGAATTSGLTKDDSSGNTTHSFTGGVSTFGGNTTVSAGTMRLSGGAQFVNSKQLTVNNGTVFTLDNSTQNVVNRFNGAGTVSLAGTLNLIGGTDAVSSQSFAAFTIATSGASVVNIVNGGGTGVASITSSTLVRSSRGSFVNFTGNGSFNSITAPALTGGIIAFATVNGSDWATIDANNKIVPFTAYQTGTTPSGWATTDNVLLGAGTVAVTASQTINTLKFTDPTTAVTIASGQTLKLGAGGVLSLAGGLIDGPGNLVPGQASTSEVIFDVQGATNTLTVNANILNSPAAGLLKIGDGTVVLNGVNTYASNTRIYGGTLALSNDAALGGNATGTSIIMAGGTLKFLNPGFTSNRSIQLNGSSNVIDTNGNDVTFNGFLTGNGDVTKVGIGSLNLSGTNGRFTAGNLHIASGTVRLGQGDTLGTAVLVTIDAGAVLDLSLDTSSEGFGNIAGAGEIRMQTGGIGLTNGDITDLTFSGILDAYANGVPVAGGAFAKQALGNITLSGASTYTGLTRVQIGSVTIGADALPSTNGPLGNASTPVQLGNTTVDNNNAAFYIGTAGVTMGRDIQVLGLPGSGGPTGIMTIGVTYSSGTSAFTGALTTNRPVEVSIPAAARTDFTGSISGVGSLTIFGGGTVGISGGNSLTGGLSVNSSTLIVPADSSLGDPAAALNLNGSKLTTTTGFTTARTINIDSAGATLTNNDNTTPLNLTGALSVRGTLTTAGVGSTVQLSQTTPVTLPNLVVQSGTFVAATTGGPLTINGTLSGAGTLSVVDGSTVQLAPNATTSFTHTIANLNLNTTGHLDVANHSLLTSTPAATIRSYLIAGGAAAGTFNGTSGISSTSAALDATHSRALGYATAGDPAAAALGLQPGQTLVKSTIYGDADLNGRVQIADFNILSANFRINNGSQTWDRGDFNYNGSVTIQDYNLLSAQFGKRVTAGSPNVSTASQALTASPAALTAGSPAAGTLEFDVNQATGHIILIANQAAVSSYDLESSANNANGDFTRANWIKIATMSGTLSSANQSYELDQEAPAGSTVTLDGSYDLGAVLPAGLTAAQYLADLTDPTGLGNGPSSYGLSSGATVNAPVFVVGVPEPTCLALGGLVAAGLLSRKRRAK